MRYLVSVINDQASLATPDEDAAIDVVATLTRRFVPPNPGAWLTTTANRKAIDRIRRETERGPKHQQARLLFDDSPETLDAVDDERLRLIFTCCHPALASQARVALTLRMVAGLTVPEIARAFLVRESAMGQRITRAKAKIKAARIPYRVPFAAGLPVRVSGVLTVLYLVFNEGYGEVTGLLALMLRTEARRTARVSAAGELVPRTEQDRSQVVARYDQLVRLDPSPVIALDRAIAVAELDGPQVAPATVDRLEPDLADYRAYHATRAELLRRLGRGQQSRAAYETTHLTRRRDQLG